MTRVSGVLLVISALLSGCASSPPERVENLCHVFEDKKSWYQAARRSQERWGVPIAVMMAIMHQESRFDGNAKPPRKKFLWVLPGPRQSSARGYSQAKKDTWEWYKREAGAWSANRDEFVHAVDFVGWYNAVSHRRLGMAKDDAYRLYLAYHEGHGGYSRGTYGSKEWLLKVARKVADRAALYQVQLQVCEQRFQKKGWWPF